MKFKLFTVALIMIPSFLLSLGSSTSLNYNLYNLSKHEFDLQHHIFHSFEDLDLLVTPRLKFSHEGDIDLTTGIGIRHYIGDQAFGIHACWDGNQLQSTLSHQFTLALEYFFNNIAVRSNHYFPLTKPYIKDNFAYTPVYWMENSITRKFDYLSTSIGSVYEFNSKTCHLKADIMVPIKGIVLGIHGNYPINGSPSAHFSISFSCPLSSGRGNSIEPVIRSSKVHYSISPIIPKAVLPELDPVRDEIETLIQDLGEVVKEEITEEVGEIEPVTPILEDQPQGWWGWFKSFFASNNSKVSDSPYTDDYCYQADYSWDGDNYQSPSDVIDHVPSVTHSADLGSVSIATAPASSFSFAESTPSTPDSAGEADISFSDLSPAPSFNISFDISAAASSPGIEATPFSEVGGNLSWDGSPLSSIDLGSPSSHYAPGGYYDPQRADSETPPSDNGWTSIGQ